MNERPVIIDTVRYNRIPGLLEIQSGVEALPPTEISDAAVKKLESLGLGEMIIPLRNFTSQFRYDLCDEKLKRLAVNPAELLFSDKKEEYQIKLENFYDVNRTDGNCFDIAAQWDRGFRKTGLFDMVNNSVYGSGKIELKRYRGSTPTHFNTHLYSHFWNVLSVTKDDTQNNILIDASFQKIMTLEESGYRPKQLISEKPNTFEERKPLILPFDEIFLTRNGGWEIDLKNICIIGVSADYKYAYGLGFVYDYYHNHVKPVLDVVDAESKARGFFHSKNMALESTGDEIYVDEDRKAEIDELLKLAEKIRITQSPDIGERRLLDEEIN